MRLKRRYVRLKKEHVRKCEVQKKTCEVEKKEKNEVEIKTEPLRLKKRHLRLKKRHEVEKKTREVEKKPGPMEISWGLIDPIAQMKAGHLNQSSSKVIGGSLGSGFWAPPCYGTPHGYFQKKRGTGPQNGCFFFHEKNYFLMDDLGGTIYFWKHPYTFPATNSKSP